MFGIKLNDNGFLPNIGTVFRRLLRICIVRLRANAWIWLKITYFVIHLHGKAESEFMDLAKITYFVIHLYGKADVQQPLFDLRLFVR